MAKLYSILFILVPIIGLAQNLDRSKVTDRLLQQIQTERFDEYDVYLRMADRVDALALKEKYERESLTIQERTRDIITRLQKKALHTQRDVLNTIRQYRGIRQESVRSFWVTNVIFFKGDQQALAALSQRSDIDLLDINAPLKHAGIESEEKAAVVPNGKEPGLVAINAPAMWELGYTGYGTKAFINDTGADPNHPAFDDKWVGAYEPDELGWFELSGNTYPRDCANHGTHVLGTMVGLDRKTNDTVGVAFNAQWMGSATLCGFGTASNIAAFQYALDPDGDPATTSDMPDVINNSWYDPSISNDCESIYVDVLNAMEASGKVAPIFSAGNEGPEMQSITPPHNINESEVNSFTVGALNGNSSNLLIADFSSRGPSICDANGSLLIKPEVSAPGYQVRSCDPGGGYSFKNGTSMASPHVAGAILLLREAFPQVTAEAIKYALYNSALDLGLPGEDNVYGKGIIDVYEAYLYLLDQGFIPVTPQTQLDGLVYNTEIWPIECANEITTTISAFNEGTDTITSALITYRVEGPSQKENTYTWQGEWLPGEKLTINLPALDNLPVGDYDLFVELTEVNGRSDDRPLNNRMRTRVRVSDLMPEQPSRLALDQSDLCTGANAVLQVDKPDDASVTWYDDPLVENPVSGDDLFVTPPVSMPTRYYSLINYASSVGMADQDTATVEEDIGRDGALVFDALSDFTLESVKVFAEQAGGRLIAIYEPGGEVIDQRFVSIPGPGEHVVSLGIAVPAGNNYRLRLKAGRPLTLSSFGADFPYEVPAVIRIKRSEHPDWPPSAWPYFYDWQIRYDDPCGRQDVLLSPDPERTASKADFSLDPVEPGPGELIQFEDETQSAEQWNWQFGDGNESNLPDPFHIYIDSGAYTVQLWVVDANNCSDLTTKTIVVSEDMVTSADDPENSRPGIRFFPNPTTRDVYMQPDGEWNAEPALIRVWNDKGQLITSRQEHLMREERIRISMAGWTNGTYFMQVISQENTFNAKVVKLD